MKKLTILLLLFISLEGSSQSIKIDDSCSTIISTEGMLKVSDYYTSTNLLVNRNLQLQQPNKFMIFNTDVSEVLVMFPDGTIFYSPKFFCKCKKCLNFKGKKKLNLKQK